LGEERNRGRDERLGRKSIIRKGRKRREGKEKSIGRREEYSIRYNKI